MEQGQLNWIANFIWGIADDVLRDVYVKGKYRDVILPMVVIRRLDSVLEPTKQEVLETHRQLDEAEIVNQDVALQQAAGQPFYNTSPFTLRTLMNQPAATGGGFPRRTWTGSRRTCRRSWTSSSSATRFRRWRSRTRSGI